MLFLASGRLSRRIFFGGSPSAHHPLHPREPLYAPPPLLPAHLCFVGLCYTPLRSQTAGHPVRIRKRKES